MSRTATESFLTGMHAHVAGFTHRNDAGETCFDEFLVVGPHPWMSGVMQVQDIIDGIITTARTESIMPIHTPTQTSEV